MENERGEEKNEGFQKNKNTGNDICINRSHIAWRYASGGFGPRSNGADFHAFNL